MVGTPTNGYKSCANIISLNAVGSCEASENVSKLFCHFTPGKLKSPARIKKFVVIIERLLGKVISGLAILSPGGV